MRAAINNRPNDTEPADSADTVAETRQVRFEHGMDVLTRIDGEAGQSVVDALADISPELGHQVVAWAYGDIYNRPALPPRERQLVTLGMLTALGGCEPQLEVHINASLNVGLTSEEIIEALLHSAVYCGIPKALNATFVAKKVFANSELLTGGNPAAARPGVTRRRAPGR